MPTLDLYHGGESPVFAPSLVSPRAGRPLDFGSGFYTTTSLDQAKRWVGIRIRQNVYSKGAFHITVAIRNFSWPSLRFFALREPRKSGSIS